jgi:hypothetical protein
MNKQLFSAITLKEKNVEKRCSTVVKRKCSGEFGTLPFLSASLQLQRTKE